MNLQSLKQILYECELCQEDAEFVTGLARSSAEIFLTDDLAEDSGCRFGGDPFVPPDFEWPIHDAGEYRFLGQINFAKLEDRPESLPDIGLLSIFYAFDEEGEVFWGDDGYILGYYWEEFAEHRLLDSPNPQPGPKKILIHGSIDIPRHEDLRGDWPFDPDIIYGISEAIDASPNYLLGYPSYCTLAYDPTPGPEWISLLTVHSINELDWCWHDGDKLMVFIEAEKLKKRDFSYLKSDAG